ncbi:protein FAR1-RELATED SEQUENCE 5-like [Cornus florida]|uniref:protein FAR1-RELATED SEQUENCE 5-like n=1 Tax=Cornus florida TaxID=4283 RepID=UPI0028964379|nr:protein FAR1-RELATED SEQUENCE 5-like [Cornus florida]
MDTPLGEGGHKPKIGMIFKSFENAYNFYNAYGREVGFSVRIDYSNKNTKTGEITSTQFVCCNEGYRVNDKRDHLTKEARAEIRVGSIDVDLADDSGLPVGSSYELMGRQSGAREALGFTKVDQKNYLRTKRQKQLQSGEAGFIFEYFQSQMLENPSFFHAVQLDKDDYITNIFWADARMIIDYGHFGDIVSFDTTYKVNNVNRPFAAFVGLNHHRETVIF